MKKKKLTPYLPLSYIAAIMLKAQSKCNLTTTDIIMDRTPHPVVWQNDGKIITCTD